jgi:endogenous inhibitor of DNA gyrase (YacG/DUF329 family)
MSEHSELQWGEYPLRCKACKGPLKIAYTHKHYHFCKRCMIAVLPWFAEEYNNNFWAAEKCNGCDREVIRNQDSMAGFCSERCQTSEYARSKYEEYKRSLDPITDCESCLEEFEPKHSDAKYCSAKCRVAARSKQKAVADWVGELAGRRQAIKRAIRAPNGCY